MDTTPASRSESVPSTECSCSCVSAPAGRDAPGRHHPRRWPAAGQIIESVNDTFKGQLDLERHGGHIPDGVLPRVLQRILAPTAICHNDQRPACHAFNAVVVASKS